MKIICLGDLACPEKEDIQVLLNLVNKNNLFKDKLVIANLEGLLVKDNENLLDIYKNSLFNNEEVLEIFKDAKKTYFSLANNHIKDIPEQFDYTIKNLQENNIGYSGASKDKKEIYKPYEISIENKKYAIFSHCWKVMSNVIKNKSKEIFLNDVSYKLFVSQIQKYREKNKDTFIIVYFHWNFDFEKLPFPIHIDVSRQLIDVGVDIVLGGHSHLVNGGEIYNGKPIIYGLGNFYIPSNKFLNRKLIYPKESMNNVLLEYDTDTKESNIFVIENNKLEFVEKLEKCKKIIELSEFSKMNIREYKKYFKKNRRKKFLIPVFYNLKSKTNSIKELFILFRMKILRMLKGIK